MRFPFRTAPELGGRLGAIQRRLFESFLAQCLQHPHGSRHQLEAELVWPLQLLAVRHGLNEARVLPRRPSSASTESTFILRTNVHRRPHANHHAANQQRSAGELQQRQSWTADTPWIISAELCRFPIPLCFPPGLSSANGLFTFYIPGAGKYAKGKYGDRRAAPDQLDRQSIL